VLYNNVKAQRAQLCTRHCRRICGNVHIRMLYRNTCSKNTNSRPSSLQYGFLFAFVKPWDKLYHRLTSIQNSEIYGATAKWTENINVFSIETSNHWHFCTKVSLLTLFTIFPQRTPFRLSSGMGNLQIVLPLRKAKRATHNIGLQSGQLHISLFAKAANVNHQ
jgi:hypothetical protein